MTTTEANITGTSRFLARGPKCRGATANGWYWPMGSGVSDALGNVAYLSPPVPHFPVKPTPGFVGGMWWPMYGAGGPGSVDFMQAGWSSEMRFLVIGRGTMTIPTVSIGPTPPIRLRLWHDEDPLGVPFPREDFPEQSGVAGDTFTFDVPDDGWCFHWISLVDELYPYLAGQWVGFSGFHWESGDVFGQGRLLRGHGTIATGL